MRSALLILCLSIPLFLLASCGGGNADNADSCAGQLCSGFGTCVIDDGEARCDCISGYAAKDLACEPARCVSSTCVHGTCTDPATSSACTCDLGYAGPTCAVCAAGYYPDGLYCRASNACANKPCAHGTCVPGKDTPTFACRCDQGYDGLLCDTCADGYTAEGELCVAPSACDPNPCRHGTCVELHGLPSCTCAEGYTGEICDACAQGYKREGLVCIPSNPDDPCTPNPCDDEAHRTTCVVENAIAVCKCAAGWHDEGGACVADTSCEAATTCAGHGTCTGVGLGCDCEAAYDGEHCEACASGYEWEGNACVESAHSGACASNPCTAPHQGVCTETTKGGFSCGCEEGYAFDSAGSGICQPVCKDDPSACASAHTSFKSLVSANGFGALVVDLNERKLTTLLEHPYKTWGPSTKGELANSRDMLYDSYLGLRIGITNCNWLTKATLLSADYYAESGIIRLVQQVEDFRVETFAYAPWELTRPAIVLLGRVTNLGQTGKQVALYTLQNYRVGKTEGPSDSEPDAKNERITRPNPLTYVESGDGGTLVHRAIGSVDHMGAAQSGTSDNPYAKLEACADLADNSDTGWGEDRAAGFERIFDLDPGESGMIGVVTAFDRGGSGSPAMAELEDVYAQLTPETALSDALANWEAWRKTEPVGLTPAERHVWRSSEAILRMGQVWEESDRSRGQILASLPPGIWSTAWARDMSYSIVALIRSGHLPEAKAALEFMLKAQSNTYRSYVGYDYQISVCRYFGNGLEESDANSDGPNIEFDGFGLFLWALSEYAATSGDTAFASANWATIRDKVGETLLALTQSNDMIAADSSIWEMHWNGKQKQYTYTTLAAANGLCLAGELAEQINEGGTGATWRARAVKLAGGIEQHALNASSHVLAQSVQELAAGSGYLDAAVIEAFNWGILDPEGASADATLAAFDNSLRVPTGFGYFRNDDNLSSYDNQEWIFIDMRIAETLLLRGETEKAQKLLDWVNAQALANYGLIPELYDRSSGNYDGAIPMVGFGAASYMLNLMTRAAQTPPHAPCAYGWR